MKVRLILGIAVALAGVVVLWLLLWQTPAPFPSAGHAVPDSGTSPAPFRKERTPTPKPQDKNTPDLAPLQPGVSALQGWVVTEAGAPVPGVWVSAYQADRGAAHVLADDEGTFVFPELPEGRFRVSAQASGYNEAVLDGVPYGSRELRLVMLPLSSITGRVVEADSARPSAQFDVLSLDIVPADSTYWQEIARADDGEWQSVSNAAGEFVLPGLASGKALAINARATGFAPTYAEVDPLAPGEISRHVTLALHWAAGVEGRVVDASSRPVEGVAIHFGDDERKPVQYVTDAQGRFRLDDLAPTSFLLTATHSDFVDQTVEVSPADPPVFVEIVLAHGGRIEGTAFLVDEPVPGAIVVAGALGRDGFQQMARTDAAGEFSLAGLPPGTAEVFVDLPQGDEMEEPPIRLQQRILLARMFHKPARPATPGPARGVSSGTKVPREHCGGPTFEKKRRHAFVSIVRETFGRHVGMLWPAQGEHRRNHVA